MTENKNAEIPYHTYELEFIKKFLITIKPQMRIIKLKSPKITK